MRGSAASAPTGRERGEGEPRAAGRWVGSGWRAWGAACPLGTSRKQRENGERITLWHRAIPKSRALLPVCFSPASMQRSLTHLSTWHRGVGAALSPALPSGQHRSPSARSAHRCPALGQVPAYTSEDLFLAESSKLLCTWAKHAAH